MRKKEKVLSFGSLFLLILVLIFWYVSGEVEDKKQENQMEQLRDIKTMDVVGSESEIISEKESISDVESNLDREILTEMKSLYDLNSDLIGWLKIEGTQIDYPVMQKVEDESYYLTRDFYEKDSKNGCLILDSDSSLGVGELGSYEESPGTNLIIHGHHMKNGDMFGELELFCAKEYTEEHPYIHFDTLYEKRTYEIFAVFYSQVYEESEDEFKYYDFFNAKTKEEFYSFTLNCKNLSLFDTGVNAEFGDELITLSTCAYQTKNGRFVVVGIRVDERVNSSDDAGADDSDNVRGGS